MIRDVKAWEEFERELAKREPVDYQRNLRLFEALLEEARSLGRWPPDDPLEGIELHTRFVEAVRRWWEKDQRDSAEQTNEETPTTQGERAASSSATRVKDVPVNGIVADLLARLALALKHAGVDYMIIGGQAVLLYGEIRVTRDVDITLGAGPEALPRILDACRTAGLDCLVADPEAFVKQTLVLPSIDSSSGLRVDFVFSFTPYEREAIRRAVDVPVAGVPVRFARVEDVIIHKIFAGRPRDIEDVRGVLRKKRDLDIPLIRRWLRELGSATDRDLLSVFEKLTREEWTN